MVDKFGEIQDLKHNEQAEGWKAVNQIEDEIFKEIDDLENELHQDELQGKAKIDAEIAAIKREKLADIEEWLKRGKNTKDF